MANVLVRIHPQDKQHLRGVHTWRGVKFMVDNGSPGNWYRLPANTPAEKQFVEELKLFRQDDYDPKTALVFEVVDESEAEEGDKPKEAPGTLKSAIAQIEGKPEQKETATPQPPQPPAPTRSRGRGRSTAQDGDED